jgi:hypothetical protein
MSQSPSVARLALEAIAVSLAAVALTAVLYSSYWQECCRAAEADFVTHIALFPAFVIAAFVGGVHASTKFYYYLGVVVQFLAIWAIVRATITVMRRRRQAPLQ